MNHLARGSGSPFDRIRQVRPDGSEFWSARKLQVLMGYAAWRNFLPAIARAIQTASNTGMDVASHFAQSRNVVGRAQGGGNDREDYELSRHAARLVAMNGDPSKPEVAAAQAYFSERTGQAEAIESEFAALPDWARHQIDTIRRVGKIETEQKRQADQLDEVAARVESIEGAHDWFAALAYAKLHGFSTERTFLAKVGRRAGQILRDSGETPGTTQHPAFGTVNTYPEWALERAFGELTAVSS
ncbi:hypothetical protein [Kibdelosporangium phytohabitans]|uniref:DNA-damage-inducible protein D n=1 Tax=Kibdelosporangium phytohabitans TaxID=860235 RepID=A0A0N9HTR1_9PSEU|nr:hypothetical protein [Kibdelosporangium phytohabitans]ALG06814.1 hypothetical protein AOZ06_07630 [Kibdelosporangium phytohabitans]MBE1468056.1 DNA-damage-inducible protein D [Kibdelosporangium phytohabitans]